MLKRLSAREQIAILIDQHAATIQKAFMEAVSEIVSRITLALIVERLEKGDIAGAVDALHIEKSAFNPVLDRIAEAYNAGGNVTADNLALRSPEGRRVVFRFDVRNPAAEQWLRDHSSQLVTNIVEDQRQGIRAALADGLSIGANPKATALNIVGRISKVTGTRSGGIIGLTAQQSGYVANARQRLLSGDPASMREYLALGRRDRRFDATVKAAIEAEKPVPVDMVARITGRYSDRLLELRGEVIGQHETALSLFGARNEAFRQAIASGHVAAQDVTKTWHHFASEHPRMQHVAMAGQAVQFDQPFILPDGMAMMHPHDPSAPASQTLGCKCQADYSIDHIGALVRSRLH